jgi:hypothetical protein
MEKYIVTIGSSFVIDLELTSEIANTCYHSGICDDDVLFARNLPEIQEQFCQINEDTLRKVVNEIWGENIANEMDREWLECYVLFEASALFVDGNYEQLET